MKTFNLLRLLPAPRALLKFCLLVLAGCAAGIEAQTPPIETFSQYVLDCKNELGFNTLPNDMNCYSADLFDGSPTQIQDYVGYRKINDEVDLLFNCRWFKGSIDNQTPGQSLEMIIHNRNTGGTCFFGAKDSFDPDHIVKTVPAAIVAPTAPGASNYWKSPAQVLQDDPCTSCHVGGPFVASFKITPFLQKFGMINNGHDTFVSNDGLMPRYHAVSAVFGGALNQIVEDTIERSDKIDGDTFNTCADGCHSFVDSSKSTVQTKTSENQVILTSINEVKSTLVSTGNMPPHYDESSEWRWINLDTEDSGGGDSELFADASNKFERLLSTCEVPGRIEAHAVGTDLVFSSGPVGLKKENGYIGQFPDKIRTFNLRDGLVCVNGDQPNGQQCNDYEVYYQCDGNYAWTGPFNTDDQGGAGDNESRSRAAATGLCSNPTAIMAKTTDNSGQKYWEYGPNDRLAKLDSTGLVCNNADQGPGQKCSNYVVRYMDCVDQYDPVDTKIRSRWSGRYVTATGAANNAETRAQPLTASWNTQDWTVEYVVGSNTLVRIKNNATGKYLNVQSNQEGSPVLSYDLQPDWGSMQWTYEKVPGTAMVRFKNVWTGRYLTVNNNSDYGNIIAQSYNPGWTSQDWALTGTLN